MHLGETSPPGQPTWPGFFCHRNSKIGLSATISLRGGDPQPEDRRTDASASPARKAPRMTLAFRKTGNDPMFE